VTSEKRKAPVRNGGGFGREPGMGEGEIWPRTWVTLDANRGSDGRPKKALRPRALLHWDISADR
jgi:hypothetical protein